MPNKATVEDNTYAVGKEKSENSLEHSVSDQTRAENAIGHLLDQINGRERYDAEAKALLSVKIFLVRILKGLIEPFSRFTDEAILRESFVGEIYLERMSVDDNSSAQIMGKNTEGSSIESGSIYYDLVLYVKLPSSPQGVVDFIINIEIQGKDSRFTPKRGGYYGARLISSEKGRVFIKEEYDWLVNQNIDIYNLTSSFYINVCFHFKSNKRRDIILPDRIITYYPNATLCEEGCEYKGTNYTSLIAICDCKYNELNYELINVNLLEDDSLKVIIDKILSDMVELVNNFINIKNHVWICYKNIFVFEYFITNIGGLIIIVFLIIQIICIILLFYKDYLGKISKFIILVTNLYINHKKRKSILKMSSHYYRQNNTDLKNIKEIEKKKSKKNISTAPTQKSEKIKEKKAKRRNKVKNDIKEKSNISTSFENSKKTLDVVHKEFNNVEDNNNTNENATGKR